MTDWANVLGWGDPAGLGAWFIGIGVFFWGLSRFMFGRNKPSA